MTWGIRRYSHWHLQHQFGRLKKAHALEKERARIARDLHDELGGSLTRIAFGVDQLRRRPADPEFHSLLEQLSQRVRRHASDLQRVVWVESSKNDSLDRVVLFIGRFAQDYFLDSAVTCLLRHSAGIPSDPIQPEVQHNLIATAKEAFNNVLKHAKATNVVIEARFSPPTFELMIKDNGVGFIAGAGASDDHNGLMNMYARIAEIGGILEIRSQPGEGTTILIRWTYGARLKKT
jgi:signal transduction histidine kinase